MLKIGITGSIGSGKSTVAAIFAALGVPVYNADQRAKELMQSDKSLVHEIVLLFGKEAYDNNGELNRAFIASQVFNQKDLLAKLNALVHPAVFKDFDHWCLEQKSTYILKEAALMFESDSFKTLDKVIVVTAPDPMRIERTMLRDGITKEAVISRMQNQLSQTEKLARSDFEIKNDESEMLIPQVLKLHTLFKSQ